MRTEDAARAHVARLPEFVDGTAEAAHAAYRHTSSPSSSAPPVWALIRNRLGDVVEYHGTERRRLPSDVDVDALRQRKRQEGFTELPLAAFRGGAPPRNRQSRRSGSKRKKKKRSGKKGSRRWGSRV